MYETTKPVSELSHTSLGAGFWETVALGLGHSCGSSIAQLIFSWGRQSHPHQSHQNMSEDKHKTSQLCANLCRFWRYAITFLWLFNARAKCKWVVTSSRPSDELRWLLHAFLLLWSPAPQVRSLGLRKVYSALKILLFTLSWTKQSLGQPQMVCQEIRISFSTYFPVKRSLSSE